MESRGELGDFLNEVIEWQWDKFCKAERDPKYTSMQGTVFALVRACTDGRLSAINMAIDRIDGKVETPIRVEYPKVFILFPNAERVALASGDSEPAPALAPSDPAIEEIKEGETIIEPDEVIDAPEEVTMSLRDTVRKLAGEKRIVVDLILDRKLQVENKKNIEGKIPLVKSIIAAHLLKLVEFGKFEAINSVFDQIDGKLTETIRVLGEDIFLTSYNEEAPYGAIKNKDGVYQIAAPQVASEWKQKLNKN